MFTEKPHFQMRHHEIACKVFSMALLFSILSLLPSCGGQKVYSIVDGIYVLSSYQKIDESSEFTVSSQAVFTISTVWKEPEDGIAYNIKSSITLDGSTLLYWQTFVITDEYLSLFDSKLSSVEYDYLYLRILDENLENKFYLFGKRGNENPNASSMSYVKFNVSNPEKKQIATMTFSLTE